MVNSGYHYLMTVSCIALATITLFAEEERWEVDWEAIGNAAQELGTQVQEGLFSSEQLETWTEQALSGIQNLLEQADVQDLHAYAPYVHQVEDYLRQFPEAEPWVDWLVQRIDYFDYPDPPSPRPPPPLPRPAGPRPPPSLPNPSGPVISSPPRHTSSLPPQSAGPIPDYDYWKQKIGTRPAPGKAGNLVPVLKPIFIQNGVPGELVWLAEVESSFNPRAKSPAGARGLFQFMPATAEEYGLRTQPLDQRLDPKKSADAASRYLGKLYRRFGDWPLALAAYNAGGGRVNATLRKHGGTCFQDIAGHLPKETRMYVPKVFAAMAVREGIDPTALPPAR